MLKRLTRQCLIHTPFATFILLPTALLAKTETLASQQLKVTVDSDFPRLIQYRHRSGASLRGQTAPSSKVLLNGKDSQCKVRFRKSSTNAGTYRLDFSKENIQLDLTLEVHGDHVEASLENVVESGEGRLMSLSFPDNAIITISDPSANIAFVKSTTVNDDHHGVFHEEITTLKDLQATENQGNYLFLSEGNLSVGLSSNHCVDLQRTAYQVTTTNGKRELSAWFPDWDYRYDDTHMANPAKHRIIITPDVNDDNKASWQDAAVVHRRIMPKPFGYELMQKSVGENIAMNFASGAQQPFLKTLDEIKKIHRATDGIGNIIILKGFSAEGHDSANTDYAGHFNERAGGVDALNHLLQEAPKYNAVVGYHINTSEAYPEAHRYTHDILQLPNGKPKNAWKWLDQAHYIDKAKDMLSGNVIHSLTRMKKETPGVQFVYVDTYHTNGWPAWRLYETLKGLGIAMQTEGSVSLDPWTTWSHWRGKDSDIMRFVWFSHRDNFKNLPVLRGGRSDHSGYMGWQNKHSFPSHINWTFSQGLPARYLQHFDLLQWKKEQSAVFANNLSVLREGDLIKVKKDGIQLMEWHHNSSKARLLVPWDPIKETKLYLWDEVGSEKEWPLPKSWASKSHIFIYQLSDEGKTNEQRLVVTNGKFTFKAETRTPYVIYADPQKTRQYAFGEFTHIKDPGFNDYSLSDWAVQPARAATVENDNRRNPRAIIKGKSKTSLSQNISGLKGGQGYVATVWVQVSGKRKAGIVITSTGGKNNRSWSNHITESTQGHSMPNHYRNGSKFQRLPVYFTLPADATEIKLSLVADDTNGNEIVEFDDLRLEESSHIRLKSDHWYEENFECTAIGGYGPFAFCNNEHTHLSETNKPYTKDTINGRFSLKTRGGLMGQTTPASLRFEPWTVYELEMKVAGQNPNASGKVTYTDHSSTSSSVDFKAAQGSVKMRFNSGPGSNGILIVNKTGGDWIAIDDLVIKKIKVLPESQRKVQRLEDAPLKNKEVIFEENFKGKIDKNWSLRCPKESKRAFKKQNKTHAATGISATIPANASLAIERPLPEPFSAVETLITTQGNSATWGPGIVLKWKDGKSLRINHRAGESRIGSDSKPGGQQIHNFPASTQVNLRIRLSNNIYHLEARSIMHQDWKVLRTVDASQFSGKPNILRIGKTNADGDIRDHSQDGSETMTIELVRIYQ